MRNSRPFLSRATPGRAIVSGALIAFLAGIPLLSTGCGLKSSLYLPDDKAEEVAPADSDAKKRSVPVKPAPQTQKQDRIDSEPPDTTPPVPTTDPDRPAPTPPGI